MTDVHRKAEDDAMLEFEELEKSHIGQEYPNVLWTLFGRENVEHKLEEMFEDATHSVRAVLPGDFIVYLGLVVGRGFPIEVLTFGRENVDLIKDAFPEVHVHDVYTIDVRAGVTAGEVRGAAGRPEEVQNAPACSRTTGR
jgi:sugar-specific transcriptional regulator TrmB